MIRKPLPAIFYLYYFLFNRSPPLALFVYRAYHGYVMHKALSEVSIMKSSVLFWLITALTFLIFEMGHPGLFFFLSFCIGALSMALVSHWVDFGVVQGAVFLTTSFLSLFVLRLYVSRFIKPSRPENHSNVYALEGKQGVVVARIEPSRSGQVKVGGEVWSARAADASIIEVNEQVTIVHVAGVHLIVKKALRKM